MCARRNEVMSALRHLAAILLLTTVVACGGGSGENPAPGLDDSPTAMALASNRAPAKGTSTVTLPATTTATVGTPLQLVAQVRDKNGKLVSGAPVAWSSSNPAIATVDAAGLLMPLAAGSTSVTASANGASAVTAVTVRPASIITARSRYVGTNLAPIAYYSSQFPFADLMKSSGGWHSMEDNGTWDAAFPALRADGYPAALKTGQHAVNAVAWNDTHYPAGRYVVLWDGSGSIGFPMSKVTIAQSAPNRIAIDVTDTSGQLWVSIDKTSATDPVRNVRFLLPGAEATYATQPFSQQFLNRTTPFSVLRFMDWGMTNGSPVAEWADRSHVADLTYANQNGVPIEVMIDLANALKVDPWFCIPHRASDDYVRQFATLLHARLDPALRPHIEYSNEVWNTGFEQTRWAVDRSQALQLPLSAGFMPSAFYAQRSVEVFKIIQQVYGAADSGRLVRVLAGQAVWTQFLDSALAWNGTAANADVMAIAPYFNAEAADLVANVNATLQLSGDQIVDQMLANIRGSVKTSMLMNADLAKRYGLKLKAYESGPGDSSWYFPADKIDLMTAKFAEANRNPRMREVYLEYYGQWVASGGDTMNQYNDIGGWSRWGLWGALEYVTQDAASAPKYQGLLEFINAHPLIP